MQSPFWDNLQNETRRLKGPTLWAAIGVWVLMLAVGLFCAFGGLSLPGGGKEVAETDPEGAAGPTATLPAMVILPTPTPGTGVPAGVTPAASATSASNLPALPWGEFGYGIAANAVIAADGDYSITSGQIKEHLGLGWLKQQVRWDEVYEDGPEEADWGLYDPVVESANETGLKVMLSVVDAPLWTRSYIDSDPLGAPPDDLTVYANFLGELVDRYKGKVHAIEVWNEQNLNREWDTAEGLNPERYVEMLRLSYQAIKSRDPNIIVISGALSPTGVYATDPANPNRILVMDDYEYLQRMINAGFLDYADCVGAHHNGINMPPNVTWNEGYNDPTAAFRGPFDNPHHSWSFKSTIWDYYTKVQEAGYNKPLCLTEFGWASSEGWSAAPEGFDFAWDNTEAEQAEWDVQAFQLMREWGIVRLAFLWNLDYWQKGTGETDPNAPYSLTNRKGVPRPAFSAIQAMPKIP
ncbi:MAG: cellulase family glycosylhydrolase [Anaerolineae bacterium]|jgi:hypothetical protein|nr:cellulase family glycosylhydrolase [Anaerolineae bacterium]